MHSTFSTAKSTECIFRLNNNYSQLPNKRDVPNKRDGTK